MFFYLLFPLLLPWLLRVHQPRRLLALLLVLWALSCGPGLFFAKFPALPLFQWVYAFPPARLPEFVSGMVAGLLVFRQGWRVPGWAVAVAWALAGAYLARIGPYFEGYVAHNVLGLPALVLTVMHLAAPIRGPLARLLATRLLHYLGRISYGFYIWQLALLLLIDTLWRQHVLHKQIPFSSLSTLAWILLTSVASYHLLEEPARRFVLQRLRAAPPVEGHT
jgi:peptidoglycan/LPS O-acetylase OafA/YrhL